MAVRSSLSLVSDYIDDNHARSSLIAEDCGPLTVPLNGSITGRETTFPNEARLSCDEGFILHGSTVRRCQADGSWSGNETSCKGKIEDHPRALQQISLSPEEMIL